MSTAQVMAEGNNTRLITATYGPRDVPFDLDESSFELGQKNNDDNDVNRQKILQRDLGRLSVVGSLVRVEYGKWRGAVDACLLAFRFQFQKGNAKLFRFEEAEIVIEFKTRPRAEPDKDPVVLQYGPKKLESAGTVEERSRHWSATLSASTDPGLFQGGLELEWGFEGSYPRRYAGVVESDDWGNRKHRRSNCLKIWMREDEKQKDGLPLELLAAVVVQMDAPSQANVSVRVDGVFNLIAWPWSKDDPVLLQPGVGFGPRLRQSECDFSTMTLEEWRQLVTPDLQFGPKVSAQV